MLKNTIAPVQAWLLGRGHCVGCGRPLTKGKSKGLPNGDKLVNCACKRVFIYQIEQGKYRRANEDEI